MNTTLCPTKASEVCVKSTNCECPKNDNTILVVIFFVIVLILMGLSCKAMSKHGTKRKTKKIIPV